jgi:hypothetical protein
MHVVILSRFDAVVLLTLCGDTVSVVCRFAAPSGAASSALCRVCACSHIECV